MTTQCSDLVGGRGITTIWKSSVLKVGFQVAVTLRHRVEVTSTHKTELVLQRVQVCDVGGSCVRGPDGGGGGNRRCPSDYLL